MKKQVSGKHRCFSWMLAAVFLCMAAVPGYTVQAWDGTVPDAYMNEDFQEGYAVGVKVKDNEGKYEKDSTAPGVWSSSTERDEKDGNGNFGIFTVEKEAEDSDNLVMRSSSGANWSGTSTTHIRKRFEPETNVLELSFRIKMNEQAVTDMRDKSTEFSVMLDMPGYATNSGIVLKFRDEGVFCRGQSSTLTPGITFTDWNSFQMFINTDTRKVTTYWNGQLVYINDDMSGTVSEENTVYEMRLAHKISAGNEQIMIDDLVLCEGSYFSCNFEGLKDEDGTRLKSTDLASSNNTDNHAAWSGTSEREGTDGENFAHAVIDTLDGNRVVKLYAGSLASSTEPGINKRVSILNRDQFTVRFRTKLENGVARLRLGATTNPSDNGRVELMEVSDGTLTFCNSVLGVLPAAAEDGWMHFAVSVSLADWTADLVMNGTVVAEDVAIPYALAEGVEYVTLAFGAPFTTTRMGATYYDDVVIDGGWNKLDVTVPCAVYESGGGAAGQPAAAGSYVAKAEADSSSYGKRENVIILALYNGTALEKVAIQPVTIQAEGHSVLETEALTVDEAENRTLKAFWWDSLSGLKPVSLGTGAE